MPYRSGHDGDEHGHDGCAVLGGGDVGPKPLADGLLVDPATSTTSRLEHSPYDPDDEVKPRECGDRDQVIDSHPSLTHRAINRGI